MKSVCEQKGWCTQYAKFGGNTSKKGCDGSSCGLSHVEGKDVRAERDARLAQQTATLGPDPNKQCPFSLTTRGAHGWHHNPNSLFAS
eukprot:1934930-Karenia_brevis.AAC.1